jgi:rRNA maturation endonuclease Nob1
LAMKGLSVWIFSSLTFLSVAHLVEAIYVTISDAPIRLLTMYPIIGGMFTSVTPAEYLWISVVASITCWGITCAIAFQNPMEQFLKQVLSDAKRQSTVESQMIDSKAEVLDAMYETVESGSQAISTVKDMMCNIRSEVKQLQPLASTVDLIRHELNELVKEVEKLEGKMKFTNVCLSCGKPLIPEFKVCPYCGEDAHLLEAPPPLVSLDEHK